MQVKICGITSLFDARLAIEAGAWGLGFNFYPKSKRYVAPIDAANIIANIPKEIVTFGVFVNETLENIARIQSLTGIKIIQLHGDETYEFCQKVQTPVVKVIRPRSEEDLKIVKSFSNLYSILIDAYSPNEYGGTGEYADWQLAQKIARKFPVILAGGITADNIRAAVSIVKPLSIDVCSGVENHPGCKSRLKLRALFAALHGRARMNACVG